MAKLGKAIIWYKTSPDAEWEDLDDEGQAVFIEMAMPDEETIALAQSTVVPELRPFLEAELREGIG